MRTEQERLEDEIRWLQDQLQASRFHGASSVEIDRYEQLLEIETLKLAALLLRRSGRA